MGITDSFVKSPKGKIVGEISETVFLSTKVDGVRTVVNRHFQFFEVAGRSKQFGNIHVIDTFPAVAVSLIDRNSTTSASPRKPKSPLSILDKIPI
jgi:hypothetical protein